MTLALETPIADLGSLKRHSLVGLLAVFGVFGGLVLWAANTDITGAVISGGTLVSKGAQLALLADADRNNVGNVTVDNATLNATGTFRAAGYDVTIAATATVTAAAQAITRYKP